MDPIDGRDLSFVIPFRADQAERVENLGAVLRHLSATVDRCEILLMEDAPRLRGETFSQVPGVRWIGRANAGVFHKTRLLNEGMARLATRPVVVTMDADCLVWPEAVALALTAIRSGQAMVLPFDGSFVDASGALRRGLLASGGLETLDPAAVLDGTAVPRRQLRLMNRHSVGGAAVFEREAFRAAGGYCEGFVSWGFEDAEIATRFRTLGRPLHKVAGFPLIHLSHRRPFRPFGGWYAGARRNARLRDRIVALPPHALRQLIDEDGLGLNGPGLARLRGG